MTTSDSATPAAASGTFRLGGDLEINRLGYGTMQLEPSHTAAFEK